LITTDQLKDTQKRIEDLHKFLQIEKKKLEIINDDEKTAAPEFWDNPKEAEVFLRQIRSKKKWVEEYEEIHTQFEDLQVLVEFAKEDADSEKELDEGVKIEIYVSYKDDFSVGDKLIVLGAQKGVAKKVFGIGQEPKSEYRPEEPIDCVVSMRSFDARMITAPLQYCLANKFIVELDRQVKDIMGIKQDYTVHHKDLEP
jgi:hypothetical protein